MLVCDVNFLPVTDVVLHESNELEKPPASGSGRRFSESEEILRRHRCHIPQLVDALVEGTNRVGKTWI